MVCKILRRSTDTVLSRRARIRGFVGWPRRSGVGVPRFAVALADELALLSVGDDHPVPLLSIGAGRRLGGKLDTFDDELARHGTGEVESAANRAGSGEQFFGRHDALTISARGRRHVWRRAWSVERHRGNMRRIGTEPVTAMTRNPGLTSGNPLKLGLFGSNCSNGRTYATVPERWDASWDNNLKLAQLAESVGLECMVPIARWKGYGGESNVNGSSFESIAWACGLLAATEHINVFCTVHVPLMHPVIAAKQLATVDQVGRGR